MEIPVAVIVFVLLTVASVCRSMTVTLKEAADLPEELKPIMPGGSWFDDMAVKRLHEKHQKLMDLGKLEGHKHEADEEEMFIMSRLGASHHPIHTLSEVGAPPVALALNDKQDTREVMRNFLRHHTHHSSEFFDHDHDDNDDDDDDDDDNDSKQRNDPTHQFMQVYERELENFFKNFMSAMLQAEIGGVSIETRGDDEDNGVSSH